MALELPERPFRPGMYRFGALAKHLPLAAGAARWLDLGGGAGEFSALARQRGYEVTLVDGDARNIAKVASLGIHGVLADFNHLPLDFGDATFDGVSMLEIVEHIPQAERLVEEAFRLVKPGGLLLLSTPNAVWWRERVRILFGHQPEAEGYHYRFFNVAGSLALCENAGFAVRHVEFSSPAFGVNWLTRTVLRRDDRRHVRVAAPFARMFAQTVYVVGTRP